MFNFLDLVNVEAGSHHLFPLDVSESEEALDPVIHHIRHSLISDISFVDILQGFVLSSHFPKEEIPGGAHPFCPHPSVDSSAPTFGPVNDYVVLPFRILLPNLFRLWFSKRTAKGPSNRLRTGFL